MAYFQRLRAKQRTPEMTSGVRSMEQVKGISSRQGASPARGACGSLDCRFPGVLPIIHPDTNPLYVCVSLRLGFDPESAPR